MGLPQSEAALVYLSGRLHDLGKCAVSDDVLNKPGPLDPRERAQIARHAETGAEMLAHFREFQRAATYVRWHHERYDGTGYPDGLARGSIPLGARIISVADAFDAMTTDRPYRAALTVDEAVRRLRSGAGSQWDPRVVVAFLELLGRPTASEAPSSQPARGTLLTSPSPAGPG
jgi:HD-GYP domain-containing protein (c-di-GMP phosphodiesterase class II)